MTARASSTVAVTARAFRVALLALIVVCAPSGTLAADPEKVWHGVLSDEPPGFDPAGATSASAASVLELVFDRLLTYDYLARPAKVVPLAAEALPIAEDDAKTWTVRIRKGIYFAPDPAFKGVRRELVAQDFVFSFMRFMDPAINSPYQFLFRNKLIGLDELRAKAQKTGRFDYDARIAGIEAVDRYTVRFHLREPDRRFLYLLAHSSAGAVAREAVDAYGKDIAVHPVGSGPYMLTSWNAGAKAILEANPYFRGFVWNFAAGDDPRDKELVAQMRGKTMPQIGRIELAVIQEDTSYWLAFLRGDLDAAALLPRFHAASLVGGELNADLRAKGIEMYRLTIPALDYTAFNFRDPVVGGFEPEKAALRRAIALAYNGDDLVNVVMHGNAERAQMLVPPGVVGYDSTYRNANGYDPALANPLLDRFGYKRGPDGYRRLPDGRPFTLTRNTSPGATYRDMDKIWHASMERIGVRISFQTLNEGEVTKSATTCAFALFSWSWSADYPDGENFMQLMYGPNSGQSNPGCYRSAAYDALYEQATRLADGAQRNALFVAMARRMDADTAWVPGAYARTIVVVQPWVQGHKRHPFLFSVLPYVDVKPH